jgi:hypothetical protein
LSFWFLGMGLPMGWKHLTDKVTHLLTLLFLSCLLNW